MSKLLITASILSANLGKLQEEVASIEPYADWLQIDVMDGHFVPNLSFGAPILKDIQTKLPIDIHLMVTNPADLIQEFVDAGAHNITFHAEAVPDPDDRKKLVEMIRSKDCTAGIAFNPDTPLPSPLSPLPDLVLCMTVVPGFSGQKFHEEVLPKIKELRAAHPDLMIQVDGGVDAETGKKCREAGANNLVSASSIFGSEDRKAAIEALRE